MDRKLRILLVEDAEDEALLISREIERQMTLIYRLL